MATRLTTTLLGLELSLLHEPFSVKQEKLLAPELKEIGAEGQIHQRDEICAWLVAKHTDARWDIRDFEVQTLSSELALCTYWAKQIFPSVSASKGKLHSSLWRQASNGDWQMLFHQASEIS